MPNKFSEYSTQEHLLAMAKAVTELTAAVSHLTDKVLQNDETAEVGGMSTDDVAKYLGCSRADVKNLRMAGKIRGLQRGDNNKSYVYDPESVRAYNKFRFSDKFKMDEFFSNNENIMNTKTSCWNGVVKPRKPRSI